MSSLSGKILEKKQVMKLWNKTLLNSLYGRFGINTESTITEVCDRQRYDSLIERANRIFWDKLRQHYYNVSYVSNTKQKMLTSQTGESS